VTRDVYELDGVKIAIWRNDSGEELVEFTADADIDCDGSGGNPDGDPWFQPDTTLHHWDGTALNAYDEPFVVTPPLVVKRTRKIVLGSLAMVCHLRTGAWCYAVVGDVGPTRKAGEVSVACARKLGIDPNPVHGGESDKVVKYTIFVGVAAHVSGVTYQLQRWGEER